MKTRLVPKIVFAAVFSTAILSFQAVASEPLSLKAIMGDMGKEMERITASISTENWARVEKSAALIADHPKPPMSERKQIKNILGTEMGQFKGVDMKTHAAARELTKAASAQDGQRVISAFSALQSHCLTCHEAYRKKLKREMRP